MIAYIAGGSIYCAISVISARLSERKNMKIHHPAE